ncbi:unnamed protein product [Adineta steineri]|uniref:Uncharacterized protein n=1 Tax=Adineta steineri TaxID=433720 RepID=A0A820QAT6_9BILA|nr:unnamed protein product [Adineta steineri]
MVEPRRVHWTATKHVFRYVAGTVDYGLEYIRGDGVRLVGYSDSNWASCANNRKSVDCRLSLMPTPDCRLSLMPTIDVGSLVTCMCDPCSGHSTRDRGMVDGCSYGGHMINDCSHDGHGLVGAPDDR